MAKEEQIKSQIILEGEKEYRSACKGINTSLREIGSEMKLATAEFGDNAESIDALTRKQDILKNRLKNRQKGKSRRRCLEENARRRDRTDKSRISKNANGFE